MCVCLCILPINSLIPESIFMKLGTYNTAPEPICVSVYVSPIAARQRLGKNPPIVARQRLGKNYPAVASRRLCRNVSAVTNTHVTIE
jgi:hypothetical protein